MENPLYSQLIKRANFKATFVCEALISDDKYTSFKLSAFRTQEICKVYYYDFDLTFNLEEHLDCITRYFLAGEIAEVLDSYKEKFAEKGITHAEVVSITNPDTVKEAHVIVKFIIELR